MRCDHIFPFMLKKIPFTWSLLLNMEKYTEVKECRLKGVICNGCLGKNANDNNIYTKNKPCAIDYTLSYISHVTLDQLQTLPLAN